MNWCHANWVTYLQAYNFLLKHKVVLMLISLPSGQSNVKTKQRKQRNGFWTSPQADYKTGLQIPIQFDCDTRQILGLPHEPMIPHPWSLFTKVKQKSRQRCSPNTIKSCSRTLDGLCCIRFTEITTFLSYCVGGSQGTAILSHYDWLLAISLADSFLPCHDKDFLIRINNFLHDLQI